MPISSKAARSGNIKLQREISTKSFATADSSYTVLKSKFNFGIQQSHLKLAELNTIGKRNSSVSFVKPKGLDVNRIV